MTTNTLVSKIIISILLATKESFPILGKKENSNSSQSNLRGLYHS